MPSEILSQLITDHPILVDVCTVVYLLGMMVAHVIRVRWPEEASRSDSIKLIAAIADACMFTFLGPAKALGRRIGR